MLVLGSYNTTGIRKCTSEYIQNVLLNYCIDIMFLQETWLLDGQLYMLNDIHSEYLSVGTSGMESSNDVMTGRPHGGVGILWRRNLSHKIKPVNMNHKRLCAIELSLESHKKVLLVCCYMRCMFFTLVVM